MEWLQSHPLESILIAVIALLGGSYLPWRDWLPKLPVQPPDDKRPDLPLLKLLDLIRLLKKDHPEVAAKLEQVAPDVCRCCCKVEDRSE